MNCKPKFMRSLVAFLVCVNNFIARSGGRFLETVFMKTAIKIIEQRIANLKETVSPQELRGDSPYSYGGIALEVLSDLLAELRDGPPERREPGYEDPRAFDHVNG